MSNTPRLTSPLTHLLLYCYAKQLQHQKQCRKYLLVITWKEKIKNNKPHSHIGNFLWKLHCDSITTQVHGDSTMTPRRLWLWKHHFDSVMTPLWLCHDTTATMETVLLLHRDWSWKQLWLAATSLWLWSWKVLRLRHNTYVTLLEHHCDSTMTLL